MLYRRESDTAKNFILTQTISIRIMSAKISQDGRTRLMFAFRYYGSDADLNLLKNKTIIFPGLVIMCPQDFVFATLTHGLDLGTKDRHKRKTCTNPVSRTRRLWSLTVRTRMLRGQKPRASMSNTTLVKQQMVNDLMHSIHHNIHWFVQRYPWSRSDPASSVQRTSGL